MSQFLPMEPYEQGDNAVADFARQSREFLDKGRGYLAAGDLHQASEKGWEAAAWMAKAVAEAQGWQYNRHNEFFTVMRQAQDVSGDARLRNTCAAPPMNCTGTTTLAGDSCAPMTSDKGSMKWLFCWTSCNR